MTIPQYPVNPMRPTTLSPGVWDTATVMSWLLFIGADQGVALVPGSVGQAIPAMPDRICVVTDTSGGPTENDGLVDTPSFQLRWRGRQGDQFDAQRLALAADRIVLFSGPALVNGVHLYSVVRSGGRPTALAPNPSPGLRSEYVCTYRCRVSI